MFKIDESRVFQQQSGGWVFRIFANGLKIEPEVVYESKSQARAEMQAVCKSLTA